MHANRLIVLAAVSIALAVAPVGTAVAAPGPHAGIQPHARISSLTPLNGDDLDVDLAERERQPVP